MKADQNLDAQQQHLSAIQYDLRITNLARFIYTKVESLQSKVKRPSLIDIGAGNGLFLKFFKQKGFQIAGYELEQENVANMKKDPLLKGDDIRQGDITQLKGAEQYDVVIASDVIEHIKNDVKAIRGLWSFLKPGGILIITVPAHSFLYGKRDEKWGHFRRYDKQVLLDHIHEALGKNYEVIFVTFWNVVGFFVYGLFEKILHKPINEEMRYSSSLPSKVIRGILDTILKIEEAAGGTPIGLTLVVGVRKHS